MESKTTPNAISCYDYRRDDEYRLTPEESAILSAKYEIFNEISQDFPVSLGKEVSKKERDDKNYKETSLTYGEVDFVSIGEIFETINNRYGGIPQGGVFYDLGSGTGKGAIAAAVLHPFQECKGIEILEGLFDISMEFKQKYEEIMPNAVQDHPELFTHQPKVEFILGSFFDIDWSDCTFLFANSTCFDLEMINRIGHIPVQPGTIALTLTKSLPGDSWRILESIRKRMSWGDATVYIHIKRDPEENEDSTSEVYTNEVD